MILSLDTEEDEFMSRTLVNMIKVLYQNVQNDYLSCVCAVRVCSPHLLKGACFFLADTRIENSSGW